MKERNIFTEKQIGHVKVNLANGYSYNLRTKAYKAEDCNVCMRRHNCVPYGNRDTVLECQDFVAEENIRICPVCKMMTELTLTMRCQHCSAVQISDLTEWMKARRTILDYAKSSNKWNKEVERIESYFVPRR